MMHHHISPTLFKSISDDVDEDEYDCRQFFKNTHTGLEVDYGFPSRSGSTDCNYQISPEMAKMSLSEAGNDDSISLDLCANEKRDLSDCRNSSFGDGETSPWDFLRNMQNSDSTADYSFFSNTSSSDTSHKNNEPFLGPLVVDTSANSIDNSTQFAKGWNFVGCDPDYVGERNSQTCDSNLFDSKETLYVPQAANQLVPQQLKLMRFIQGMSREQLERAIRIMQGIVQNPPQFVSMTYKTVDSPDIHSPPPIVVHHNKLFSEEFCPNLFSSPPPTNDNNVLKVVGQNRPSAAASKNKVKNVLATWHGELPKLQSRSPLSRKVFVGGLPYHITETELASVFNKFGNATLVWPGKENKERFKGYLYVTYEKEKQVKHLLKSCLDRNGDLYFNFPFQNKTKSKEVQIIPWSTWDSIFPSAVNPQTNLNTSWMVYVGALHGTLTAPGLFRIIDNLFGGVTYAGICVDRVKYPTGSGQVIFDNYESYAKAISVGFVQVISSKISKIIQIEPFLKDSACSICRVQIGPYFCREPSCFRYFCSGCWKIYHKTFQLSHDLPLTRNSKLNLPALNSTDNDTPNKERTDFTSDPSW